MMRPVLRHIKANKIVYFCCCLKMMECTRKQCGKRYTKTMALHEKLINSQSKKNEKKKKTVNGPHTYTQNTYIYSVQEFQYEMPEKKQKPTKKLWVFYGFVEKLNFFVGFFFV